MAKKPQRKTPVQELDERLQTLLQKRLQAYSAGASGPIISQIERMIEETQLDLYTERELERHRNSKDNEDGEQWIV
jgi:hypothetical protein